MKVKVSVSRKGCWHNDTIGKPFTEDTVNGKKLPFFEHFFIIFHEEAAKSLIRKNIIPSSGPIAEGLDLDSIIITFWTDSLRPVCGKKMTSEYIDSLLRNDTINTLAEQRAFVRFSRIDYEDRLVLSWNPSDRDDGEPIVSQRLLNLQEEVFVDFNSLEVFIYNYCDPSDKPLFPYM